MSVWLVRGLGWTAAVAVVAVGLLGRDPDVGARPRELLRTYQVPIDGGVPLALQVRAGAREIRVRWWLEDPGWGPPDHRHSRAARVSARLVDEAGAELFSQRPWLPFHQRPVEVGDRIGVRDHLAGRRRATLSDPRMWRFSLPQRSGPATLELAVVDAPPGARLYAAVWAGTPGDAVLGAEADAVEPGLSWARLSALEGGGRGFSAQIIDASLRGDAPVPGATATVVPPGGAVAFNLDDPRAVVHAEWWALDGSGPVQARYRLRGPRGDTWGVGSAVRAVPGDAPATVALALGPAEPPRLLRAWTEGAAPVSWGAPPSALDGDRRAVGPDLRRAQHARVGPGAAASWAVVPGETVRIVGRPRLGAGPLPGLDPGDAEGVVTIGLAFEGEEGEPVTVTSWAVPRIPSAWARYAAVDTPLTARVGAARTGVLKVPEGASRLRIAADAIVDVAVWAPSGLTDAPHPAYAWDPERVLARSVPRVRSPWRLRGPDGADGLLREGRIVDIDTQVRLEGVHVGDDGEADALERRSTVALGALALPRPYGWLLVPSGGGAHPDGRARIGASPRLLRPRPDGSVLLEARRAPERVGEPLRLRVEGRDVALRPRSTASTHRLTGLPSPFVIATDEPGLVVVPQRDGELRKVRAWRLRAGEEIAIDVPADGGRLAVQAWGDGFSWRVEGELRAGQLYDALPIVAGQASRSGGSAAEVLSQAGGPAPEVRTWRRAFEPSSEPRRVVLTATGATWVRPLAGWAPGASGDAERMWWLPEAVVVVEASP